MITIVIPIFNESQIIPELCRLINEAMEGVNEPYEILFVNDGSSDNSAGVLRHYAARSSNIKVINMARNFGHQISISAGIDHAAGDAVILMDGDLQDPPEILPNLIEKWRSGYDVVYMVKRSRKEFFLKRFVFHSFYKVMQRFSAIQIPMEAGNFSLMDKKVLNVIKAMPERNRYIAGMRAWAGFSQTGIEFDRAARFAGKPQMTLMRLVHLALDGIFSFSNAPLRLATYIGVITSFLAFVGIIYVLYAKIFTDKATPGWASPVFSILFIGGLILLTLGIIGEYLGRIYDEVKHRPLYVIKEKIGFKED
ncbi:MAG: glycosyltransferase family 2 protein [Bacteroidota bacterium]|nr:glycosyltransferase family 2 protein [Bacteroidota bacterium]